MHVVTSRLYRALVFLLLIIFAASLAPSIRAQEPQPPAEPPVAVPHDYKAIPLSELSSQTTIMSDGVTASATSESSAPDQPRAALPVSESARAAAPQPIDGSALVVAAPEAADDVRVDVSVPAEVRAGQTIDYTYIYTNTTSASVNIKLDVTWTNFSPNFNDNWQFCTNTGLESACAPFSIVGPGAAKINCSSSGCSYRVDQLQSKQAGRFKVRLGIHRDRFPRTGEEIRRPASSVQLFMGNETSVTSRDTANTMIVGPVLVLRKTSLDPNKRIYATREGTARANDPNEQNTFVITLGNGNGPGDIIENQVRADARDATNIILVDRFPNGGAYVSAQSPQGVSAPVVDKTARTVTWTIPGPLKPDIQNKLEFRVTFRKDDVDADCETLNNDNYTVTSDQFPMGDNSMRLDVRGPGAGIPVVVPLRISDVRMKTDPIFFGAQGTIEVTVQSFYDQPINGIKLHYDLQSNATYAGSATPAPIATPPANQPGGRITWQFNMPAAKSRTEPVAQTFTFNLAAGYTHQSNPSQIRLEPPTNTDMATACIRTRDGYIRLTSRLLVKKFTDTDPSTKLGDVYIVRPGQEFNYTITVENRGPTTAQDVDVIDNLPGADGAAFTFKAGSSTIDGQPRPPDSVVNGKGGNILWNNLSVPAGKTLTIRYTLIVGGFDYADYCNLVRAKSGNSDAEAIDYGPDRVCVKINPEMVVTKTINGSTDVANVNPGDEVTFEVTITNRESKNYTVGLADQIREFTYSKLISSYDGKEPTPWDRDHNILMWSQMDLAPGKTFTVKFTARVPSECVTRDYENEAMFHSANTPGYVIVPVPRVVVRARVNCGKVEFRKEASTDRVSLKDRLVYGLLIRNADGKPASNVNVEDVLPQGFSFVGMDASSAITDKPIISTLDDGRLQLKWTLPTIAANAEIRIRYIALSGIVVGRADRENANLVRTTPGMCPGDCITYKDNIYTFRSVEVTPLITAEPKVTPATCAMPGSKRTYQVTIVNTNQHEYTKTTVAVTLPLGLHYVQPLSSTLSPGISTFDTGETRLTWSDLIIPRKPDNAVASQMQMIVELQVGNVWGDLPTQVQTSSPDGAIPRKDGIVDPIIPVCPPTPSIAKEVSRTTAEAGQELLYQISVGNPTSQDMKGITVEDTLPAGLTFLGQVQGPKPTQSGNKLTWTVDVPRATESTTPGVTILQFKAKIAANAAKDTELVNSATASGGATSFDKTYNTARTRVVIFNKKFLPIIAR